MAEAVKKEEVKSKGPLGKLKEAVDDKEEQMAILSTFVRLGILIWAGGILTLNYVTFPGFAKQDKIDPTFIASVFTGVLATFGVEAGQKKRMQHQEEEQIYLRKIWRCLSRKQLKQHPHRQ